MRTELVDSGRALVGEHATEILSLKSSYKLGLSKRTVLKRIYVVLCRTFTFLTDMKGSI